jgi:predicted DNA-binding transcriptional regulator AlpA
MSPTLSIGGLITSHEVCKLLNCSNSWVYLLHKKRKLPAVGKYPRADGRGEEWRWRQEDVEKFRQAIGAHPVARKIPKPPKPKLDLPAPKPAENVLSFAIPPERAYLLNAVLKKQGMTVQDYLNQQLTALESKILAALATIEAPNPGAN